MAESRVSDKLPKRAERTEGSWPPEGRADLIAGPERTPSRGVEVHRAGSVPLLCSAGFAGTPPEVPHQDGDVEDLRAWTEFLSEDLLPTSCPPPAPPARSRRDGPADGPRQAPRDRIGRDVEEPQDSVAAFEAHAVDVPPGTAELQPSGRDDLGTLAVTFAAYRWAARGEVAKMERFVASGCAR
jgi:hypothetical protein